MSSTVKPRTVFFLFESKTKEIKIWKKGTQKEEKLL